MKYAFFSEKGIRDINQDAVFAASDGDQGVFVLADGMGGHSEGEYASAEIIAAIREWWEMSRKYRDDFSAEEAFLQCVDAIERVNKELYSFFKSKNEIGGSTVVLLLLWGEKINALSVGDSRIYIYRNDEIEQLTEDDVWENSEDIKAKYTEEEIKEDGRKGKLIAAIGVYEEINTHKYLMDYAEGISFILCSDGVYRFCELNLMKKLLDRNSVFITKKVAKKIQGTVKKNKGRDNYSAIICRL